MGESGNQLTGEMSLSFYEEEQKIMDKECFALENKRKLLNTVTMVYLVAYSCTAIITCSISCFRVTKIFKGKTVSDDTGYASNGILAIIMFTVLGIVFLVQGICMIFTLRKHFKRFYKDFRCYLFAATIFLSFPLFFRGVWDTLTIENVRLMKWENNHYTVSNDVFMMVATFIPIITQMWSLVFGATRHSNDKKMANMTQAMNEVEAVKDEKTANRWMSSSGE